MALAAALYAEQCQLLIDPRGEDATFLNADVVLQLLMSYDRSSQKPL